jgi:hypothetical protein
MGSPASLRIEEKDENARAATNEIATATGAASWYSPNAELARCQELVALPIRLAGREWDADRRDGRARA